MTIQTHLQPGMLAYVLHEPPNANTVRAQPDTKAAKTGLLQPGVVMEVLDGPVHNNGMIFWQVRSPALAQPGWTSEANQQEYYLAPVEIHPECAGGYPSRLHVGDLLLDRSNGTPGAQMLVKDGPFCATGMVVWELGDAHFGKSVTESKAIVPLVIHHNHQPWGTFYVVQAGDTWSRIAANFGTTVAVLQEKNSGLMRPHDVIEPDDLLCIGLP